MQLNLSGLIFIGGGMYVLLASFRVVPLSKNIEANEQWLRKFGPMMKIIGPIVILFGLGQLFGLFK
jgi:hypothetical protein